MLQPVSRAPPYLTIIPSPAFPNAVQVLPYASLDEPRDDDALKGGSWRSMMRSRFSPMVAAAANLTVAAQTLNREIWKLWGIRFEPVRTRGNLDWVIWDLTEGSALSQ